MHSLLLNEFVLIQTPPLPLLLHLLTQTLIQTLILTRSLPSAHRYLAEAITNNSEYKTQASDMYSQVSPPRFLIPVWSLAAR